MLQVHLWCILKRFKGILYCCKGGQLSSDHDLRSTFTVALLLRSIFPNRKLLLLIACIRIHMHTILTSFLVISWKSFCDQPINHDPLVVLFFKTVFCQNFAQKLVSADRASLFLVDIKTKELYARIFDIGNGLGNQMMDEKEQKEIRYVYTVTWIWYR